MRVNSSTRLRRTWFAQRDACDTSNVTICIIFVSRATNRQQVAPMQSRATAGPSKHNEDSKGAEATAIEAAGRKEMPASDLQAGRSKHLSTIECNYCAVFHWPANGRQATRGYGVAIARGGTSLDVRGVQRLHGDRWKAKPSLK
eukprot:GHVT01026128.1.p1 GENE.GHVT01026128.1~~GHVT01026128.1.p1  ORF type:complete len:144 (+),score=18.48 GHVT01026128.1:664-1095(+)